LKRIRLLLIFLFNTPVLSTLVDRSIYGDWRLRVRAPVAYDEGALTRWSLRIQFGPQ
jgi:hypothetical protein